MPITKFENARRISALIKGLAEFGYEAEVKGRTIVVRKPGYRARTVYTTMHDLLYAEELHLESMQRHNAGATLEEALTGLTL